jgi:hypothetical protein
VGTLTVRRDSKEGSKKEGGRQAAESLTRPVFRVEFSLDRHHESIPEKIVHCHQVLWDFSTLFDRLSKPENGTTSLLG